MYHGKRFIFQASLLGVAAAEPGALALARAAEPRLFAPLREGFLLRFVGDGHELVGQVADVAIGQRRRRRGARVDVEPTIAVTKRLT